VNRADQPGRVTASQAYAAYEALQEEADAAREISEELGTDEALDSYGVLAGEAETAYAEYEAARDRENHAQAEQEPSDLGLSTGEWHDLAIAYNHGLIEPAEGTAEAEAFRRMDAYARQEATRAAREPEPDQAPGREAEPEIP
jgi:hypothetical protein